MVIKFKSQLPLQVVLGGQTIKAFVAAPKGFKVLGIVRMGMEFGLLAVSEPGGYFRVNGSTIKALDTEEVEEAIRAARVNGRGESYAASRMGGGVTPAPAVVVHKRRRTIQRVDFNPTVPSGSSRHAPAEGFLRQ